MNIFMLEDDDVWIQTFNEVVMSELKKKEAVELICYDSEHAFMEALLNLPVHPEDVFVLDVMVRWTDPQPEIPQPPLNVMDEGYYRAGLRCQKAIRNKGLKNKVIMLTVLENGDLTEEKRGFDENTKYLNKKEDKQKVIQLIYS